MKNFLSRSTSTLLLHNQNGIRAEPHIKPPMMHIWALYKVLTRTNIPLIKNFRICHCFHKMIFMYRKKKTTTNKTVLFVSKRAITQKSLVMSAARGGCTIWSLKVPAKPNNFMALCWLCSSLVLNLSSRKSSLHNGQNSCTAMGSRERFKFSLSRQITKKMSGSSWHSLLLTH